MSAKRVAAIVLLLVLSGAARVAAEPLPACTASDPCHLRMRDPSTLTTSDGNQYALPPGHFYDEGTNKALDDEMKRLQDQETRLTAENKSLTASMNTWTPGWFTVTLAILVGVGAGAGGLYYYEHH